TAGTFSKPRRGGCPHPPGWGLFPSHVGAGALTRPGGDFFRGVEQNLLSHTCHSEERRDENLLSNTCHSESALAVRNLLFAGVPHPFAFFAKRRGLFSSPLRAAARARPGWASSRATHGHPAFRGFRCGGPRQRA